MNPHSKEKSKLTRNVQSTLTLTNILSTSKRPLVTSSGGNIADVTLERTNLPSKARPNIKRKTINSITTFSQKSETKKMPKEETESQMKKNLEVQMARNEVLEKENQELRLEVARLKTQIASLKAHNIERKSILWKKIQNSMDGNNNSDANLENEILQTKQPDFSESAPRKELRAAKVPIPPSKPASTTLASGRDEKGTKVSAVTAPPPPPAPPKSLVGVKAVRRMPEVIELYRSLTRKDANMENRVNPNGAPAVAFTRNMIEEIENRSTFLSAVSLNLSFLTILYQ